MSDRQIQIIHGFSGYKEGSLCFKTGSDPDEVYDLTKYAFEDDGQEFGPLSPTALRLFYERLILGDSFPGEMILNRAGGVVHAFAAALFTSPDLVLTSECASLVYSVELVQKLDNVASAHIPDTHVKLFRATTMAMTPDQENPTSEQDHQRLIRGANVIESYLRQGMIPDVPDDDRDFEVIEERGGFVVFRSAQPPWDQVYSKGYIGGIWLPPKENEDDLECPFLFKKSDLVDYFDLEEVGRTLNEREFNIQSDDQEGWLRSGDPTFLAFPDRHPVNGTDLEGTSLDLEEIIEVAFDHFV